MNRDSRMKRRLTLRASLLAAFALIVALGLAEKTQAQWTTPDASGNTNYPNGKVGIGTASPAATLEVKSTGGTRTRITMANGNSGGLELYTVGGTFKGGLLYYDPLNVTGFYGPDTGNAALSINAAGNIGIGTADPTGRTLRVEGAPASLETTYIKHSGASTSYGLTVETVGAAGFIQSWIGGGTEKMRITNGGNVGIGTNAPDPAYKLDVAGDVRVSGNISAKYQDVAEWVPASQSIPAGTVVVLDSQKSNQVIASFESYDTRVAGVISAQPGITLGEAGPNKVLVATTGRVRIKVDATRASIRIGDLLVTSDREGYAMKSEPITISGRRMHSPGTLLGKALEPLEKGTGEILVLLSLQ